MSSTVFVNGVTLTDEGWFNDVDRVTYDNDGSNYVSFTPSGSGAVARTVQEKLREIVSVTDFIGNDLSAAARTALLEAIVDGTNTEDLTTYMQAALDSGAKVVWAPSGTYLCDEALVVAAGVMFIGYGDSTIILRNVRDVTNVSGTATQQRVFAGVRALSVAGVQVLRMRVRFDAGDEAVEYTAAGAETEFEFEHDAGDDLFVYKNSQEQFSPLTLANGDVSQGDYDVNGFTQDHAADTITLNVATTTGDTVAICKVVRSSYHSAVLFENCTDCHAKDVTAEGLWYDGVVFDDCSNYSHHNIVVHGVINRAVYNKNGATHFNTSDTRIDGFDIASGVKIGVYGYDNNPTDDETLNDGTITGVTAKGFRDKGFALPGECVGLAVSNIVVSDCERGFRFQQQFSDKATDIALSNVVATGCSVYGISIDGAIGLSAHGLISHHNTGEGLQLNQISHSTLTGIKSHNNSVGVRVDTLAYCHIAGHAYDNSSTGWQVDDFTHGTFDLRATANANIGGVYFFGTATTASHSQGLVTSNSNTGRGLRIDSNITDIKVDLHAASNSTSEILNSSPTSRIKLLNTADTQTLATDAIFTLTPYLSPEHTEHTGTLTADRAYTLATTSAYTGQEFTISRSGGGAFNLTNALKNIATAEWVTFVFNGSAWRVKAFGAL